MTEKNPELKTCGVVMGCKDRGVEVIRVEGGGYLGHACIEHATELNRYLEQMMAVNESLNRGRPVPSDEVPRLPRAHNDHSQISQTNPA